MGTGFVSQEGSYNTGLPRHEGEYDETGAELLPLMLNSFKYGSTSLAALACVDLQLTTEQSSLLLPLIALRKLSCSS
jgi:hypothetical protein